MPTDTTLAVTFRFWIPLAAVALLVVAFIAYRRTTPAVDGRMRWLLTALRAAALLLIATLLLDPRYVRTRNNEEPPRVVALVDRSASMGLRAGSWDGPQEPTRFDEAMGIISPIEDAVRRNGAEFQAIYFSSGLEPSSVDTTGPSGQGTDVVGAIQEVAHRFEGEHLAAIVLLSDGADTGDRLTRPAVPPIPVYAVGLGDTSAPEDVRIREVDYNSVVRVPSRTSISTVVTYTGSRQKRVTLRLTEGTKTIFERDTVLTPAAPEIAQEIPVRFTEPGRRSFKLAVDVSGRDAESDNNERDIVIEAEKAKAKILIVDLTPGWELHFLTDFLRRDQTFDYELVTTPDRTAGALEGLIRPGRFVESLSGSDAVVIGSVSESFFSAEVAAALARFVRERGGGLLVLPGEGSVFERASAWGAVDDLLPVTGNPPFRFRLEYTSVLPGAQAGANPITSQLLPVLSQTDWQERSPLLGFYASVRPKPVGEVLLNVRGKSLPAFTYHTVGKGRVAAISAGPLWRWKFLSEEGGVYDDMISRMLDVLSRGEETNRFVVTVKKNVFEAGESAVIYGEVYNEKMQPVTGAAVRMEVSRVGSAGDETPLTIVPMRREGPQTTRFRATLPPLSRGRYVVRGQADIGDRSVTSKPTTIEVSATSVEFARVTQDRQSLERIARQSGGSYASPAAIAALLDRVSFEPRNVQTTSEMTLRTSIFLFFLVVLLLGAEWAIRKRAGMI